MKINDISEMRFIDDRTEIFIRDAGFHVLAHGNWYQDDILAHGEREVESFTWQDDNRVYIDVR